MSHLMSVCALVLEHGDDEDMGIAGLLHDAIKDVWMEQDPSQAVTRVEAIAEQDQRPAVIYHPAQYADAICRFRTRAQVVTET